MKRTLFECNAGDVKMEINATFEGGELVIEGRDASPHVAAWWGDEEQEYTLLLPEESVAELRHVLNLNPFARKDLLETLAVRFGDMNCFAELRKFLIRWAIPYKDNLRMRA